MRVELRKSNNHARWSLAGTTVGPPSVLARTVIDRGCSLAERQSGRPPIIMLFIKLRVVSVINHPATSIYCRRVQPRKLLHECVAKARAYCSKTMEQPPASPKVDRWGNPLYGWQHSGKTALQATAAGVPAASAPVQAAASVPAQATVKHAAPAADLTIERDVINTGSTARDHLANERTFLAWARTGVGFVALGVGLSQIEQVGTSRI